jgi:hypothetical protein
MGEPIMADLPSFDVALFIGGRVTLQAGEGTLSARVDGIWRQMGTGGDGARTSFCGWKLCRGMCSGSEISKRG